MRVENERFLCPCKKCKHQKHCSLDVLEAHGGKWGRFEVLRVEIGAIIVIIKEEVSNLNLNPEIAFGWEILV